jgi:hypothetical protein
MQPSVASKQSVTSASHVGRILLMANGTLNTGEVSAYSGDVTGPFQRDVNGHSGDVNKVGSAATLGLQ